MFIFVPPLMVAVVTIFASFVQSMASVVSLTAFASMMLDGFVKTMVSLSDALLAIVVIGTHTRGAGEKQESRQRSPSQ